MTLEGATRVEMIEQIAFVRLVPLNLVRRYGAEVEPAHQRRCQLPVRHPFIFGNGRNHKTRTHRARNFGFVHRHYAGKREQKFAVCERMLGRLAMDDRRQQV